MPEIFDRISWQIADFDGFFIVSDGLTGGFLPIFDLF